MFIFDIGMNELSNAFTRNPKTGLADVIQRKKGYKLFRNCPVIYVYNTVIGGAACVGYKERLSDLINYEANDSRDFNAVKFIRCFVFEPNEYRDMKDIVQIKHLLDKFYIKYRSSHNQEVAAVCKLKREPNKTQSEYILNRRRAITRAEEIRVTLRDWPEIGYVKRVRVSFITAPYTKIS